MRLAPLVALLIPAVAAAQADVPAPAPDPEARSKELGTYERQALETALELKSLEVDKSPAGKTISRVHIVNLDVFSRRDGFLQWFNIFHVTTQPVVIRREVLLAPGDVWDPEIVEETRRKIADPLYTTLVVLAPVENGTEQSVDLLVVTRDIWSLRLNTNYAFQQGTLTNLSLALSENNILGFRKTLAFSYQMDLGDIFMGPVFIDKNVNDTRLEFRTSAGVLIGRDSLELEGHRSSTSVIYPLWSLRSKWGGEVGVAHFSGKIRQRFVSTPNGIELDVYDMEDNPDIDVAVPRIYDRRIFSMSESVVRRFKSDDLIQQVRVGHSFSDVVNSVEVDFPFDDMVREAFERDVLPRSERISGLFVRYALFFNRFEVFRNLNSFDLPEDVRLGPGLELTLSSAFKAMGSDENFQSASVSASYSVALGNDSRARAAVSASGRLDENPDTGELELIDNVVSAGAFYSGPMLLDRVRFVTEAVVTSQINETNNGFLSLGSDNGLRGFPINSFTGQKRVRANFELRSAPVKIWFTRFGGAVFYDIGHVADRFSELDIQHDVGIGIRTLTPQLQPFVFRFDFAIPLTGPNPGFPGEFIATVNQAF
jgi:hypothetical protein